MLEDYDNVEIETVIGEKLTVLHELNEWYRVSRSTCEISVATSRQKRKQPGFKRGKNIYCTQALSVVQNYKQ